MQSDDSASSSALVPTSDAPPRGEPMAMQVSKEYHAVYGGKRSGVYTSRERAERAASRAGTMRTYTDLESAMKYAQLGYDADSKTFAPRDIKYMFTKRRWSENAPICMSYIRASEGKIGVSISTEKTTFVLEGFDHENETEELLKAVYHLIDIVFGLIPEDNGGLLDPNVHAMIIVLPSQAPIKWLAQPKSPMRPLVKSVLDAMERMPVALAVDSTMCQIKVGFEQEGEEDENKK